MDNNWIENGDAALNTGMCPVGWLWLSSDDMANWHEIAISRIRAVLSEKLLEYVKANPHVTIGALFCKRYGVTQEDFDHFVNEVLSLFGESIIPHLHPLDFGRSPRRNMISINFSKTTFAELKMRNDELRKTYR